MIVSTYFPFPTIKQNKILIKKNVSKEKKKTRKRTKKIFIHDEKCKEKLIIKKQKNKPFTYE